MPYSNKLKIVQILFALGASLLLNGCLVDTPNGEIPADAVPEAKAFVGSYAGAFDGGPTGNLVISLVGTKVTAKFVGKTDILGGNCKSTIGQLLSIDGSGNTSSADLTEANFAFSSNCAEGENLELKINNTKSFSVSVISASTTTHVCLTQDDIDQCEANLPSNSILYSQCGDCWDDVSDTYFNGAFSRK